MAGRNWELEEYAYGKVVMRKAWKNLIVNEKLQKNTNDNIT